MALDRVLQRLEEGEAEYAQIEPGVNDDSVLEAELDALRFALGEFYDELTKLERLVGTCNLPALSAIQRAKRLIG